MTTTRVPGKKVASRTQAGSGRKKLTSKKLIVDARKPQLTEMFVYGISLGSNQRRPVLVLKDKSQVMTLPVWLNPVDASFALRDHSHDAYAAHAVTLAMMERLGMRLESCVFAEVKGHHQYVALNFSGHLGLEKLDMRAGDAMSLCLATSTRFFATQEFVDRARAIDVELAELEAGLNLKPEIGSKNHRYVM